MSAFVAQKICSHRRICSKQKIFVSLPLKSEQIAANSLLQKWMARKIWHSISWNFKAWENHCPTQYDNKDLMRICKRVAMRVNRRRMGS